MRISDWSSDVCSSDLGAYCKAHAAIETYGVLGYRDPTFQSLYKLRKKRDLTSDRLNLSLHAAHYLTADDIVPLLVLLLIETGLELERSEEHTSELQSLMRISYAVFCLKKKKHKSILQQ